MSFTGEQTLLRVYLKNTDRATWWTSAVDALLRRALKRNLLGETTLEGTCGLDAEGNLIDPGRFALIQTRPEILEFHDSAHAIGGFLADVVELIPAGLATLERAHVLSCRRGTTETEPDRRMTLPPKPDPAAHLPSPEEFPIVRTAEDGQLLRIFVDETDVYANQPVYRAVLEKAHELGLSNAVVLRAPLGFGSHRRVHTNRALDYGADLPVLIEIVGKADEIERLLPFLDEAVPEGLITVEGVKMLRLGQRASSTLDAPI